MKEGLHKYGKALLTVAVLLFVAYIFLGGKVTVSMGHAAIKVSATLSANKTVNYSDIQDVALTDQLEIGSRTFGVGGGKLQSGTFKNEAYGSYTLISYSTVHQYIVLDTNDGYLVFNCADEEKTQTVYQQLLEKVNG